MPSNELCEIRDEINRNSVVTQALAVGIREVRSWGSEGLSGNEEIEELANSLKSLVRLCRLERKMAKEEMEEMEGPLPERSDIDCSLPPTPPMRPTTDPEDPKRPWVKRELSGEELSAILATINPKDPTKTVEQQIHQLWLDGIEQKNGVWYRWYQKNLTQQVGSIDRITMPSNEDIVGVSYSKANKAVFDLMERIPVGSGLPGLLFDESTDRSVKDYE